MINTIFETLLDQVTRPRVQRYLPKHVLDTARGCKFFDVSNIAAISGEIKQQENWKGLSEEKLPFDRVWYEWDCKELLITTDKLLVDMSTNTLREADYGSFERQALTARYVNGQVVSKILTKAGNLISVSFDGTLASGEDGTEITEEAGKKITFSIKHGWIEGESLKSNALLFIFTWLINSVHTEHTFNRSTYTFSRKILSAANFPYKGFIEVRLKPGETISIKPIRAGMGGWKCCQHDVRGHWHWYKSINGQLRIGKQGLWTRKWIENYRRGDPSLGIKQARYVLDEVA